MTPYTLPEPAHKNVKPTFNEWTGFEWVPRGGVDAYSADQMHALAAECYAAGLAAGVPEGITWAVDQWKMQVSRRPLINTHRRTLDDVWRQVIRYFGGDPNTLIGMSHDELLAAAPEPSHD